MALGKYFQFVNGPFALDVNGGRAIENATLSLAPKSSAPTQLFCEDKVGRCIRSFADENLVLELTSRGVVLKQHSSMEYNQRFRKTSCGPGQLVHYENGRWLLSCPAVAVGAPAQAGDARGQQGENWNFTHSNAKYFRIINMKTGTCWDLQDGKAEKGSDVILREINSKTKASDRTNQCFYEDVEGDYRTINNDMGICTSENDYTRLRDMDHGRKTMGWCRFGDKIMNPKEPSKALGFIGGGAKGKLGKYDCCRAMNDDGSSAFKWKFEQMY